MNERQVIDRGWFYVPQEDGTRVRRLHGYPGKIEVLDKTGGPLDVAAALRAAATAGFGFEQSQIPSSPVQILLSPQGAVQNVRERQTDVAPSVARKVLFFESLMNSDMPHNNEELSQGVLHLASALPPETEAVFANVKMSITGVERPVQGLEQLAALLQEHCLDLICITVLEGYFEGVLGLIQSIRELGCRAHIAVGGVMPTLTPEHVALHIPEVSFVCRGAGEVFLPKLVRLVGNHTVDMPFTDTMCSSLLSMQGLIAIDRTGCRLITADIHHTVQVSNLDRVRLDLKYLQPRHMVGGVEIATSRGCIHRCSFCSIMGRESYQARSVGGVLDVLQTYHARFKELWGDDIPRNAFRVHFADDDFACDQERAKAFFPELLKTPFRLSSVQVSVADLCVRQEGRLLPVVEPTFLTALRPECFADHGRPIPERDFVADFKSRNWSSFLQLGVESYSDKELIRLGKGYRVAHIRAVVSALSSRKIHMDGYFILSNGATTAEDLLESVDELCRLKILFPIYFHIRFPIVPRLVSYFPSASHRRWVQKNKQHVMTLRHVASKEGFPEFDYPFVDYDVPEDPFVAEVADDRWFTDAGRYTQSFEQLRACWKSAIDSGSLCSVEGMKRLRQTDDRGRRLVFGLLSMTQEEDRGAHTEWHGHAPKQSAVMGAAEELLGPASNWLPSYKRFISNEIPRLVVIPTWACELRCRYCYIPKQSGREMPLETMKQAVDFLMSSERPSVMLQFFGGEALIEADNVFDAMDYAMEQAAFVEKEVSFVLSSNGWTLTPERLQRLSQYPLKLELSLDGDGPTQNAQRRALKKGADSYHNSIAPRVDALIGSGIEHEVIMVVHPKFAHLVADNFFHIAGLGFTSIQINFALGVQWSSEQQNAFATSLHSLGTELLRRRLEGSTLQLVNALQPPMPMRLNGEVTVDYDGTIYGGNGFLHETEHKQKFMTGHLNEGSHFDRHWLDIPANDVLLSWSYPEDVTENNLAVGRLFTSFVRWLRTEQGHRD